MLSTISLWFVTFTDLFLFILYPLHAIDELLRVSTSNVVLDFSHLYWAAVVIEMRHLTYTYLLRIFCLLSTVRWLLRKLPAAGGHFAS
jgi:hypothetical protein